ncbi:MAG: phosphatidylglycerol lysyltransferase domain-containing protein [Desulfurivibrionaceae bacterium]
MNLRPITLEDRQFVSEYLRRFPPEISELTFTNLFAWRHTRPVWVDEFSESLLFFTETKAGLVLLGNPVGPAYLTDIFREYSSRISGAERFPKGQLADQDIQAAVILVDRDNADYVYRREDLATLAGRHFTKKRNHINQCLAAYDCQYEIITKEIVPECLAMQERWCAQRGCKAEPGLCGEYQAIEETMSHYEELPLTGGAIRIEGNIEAFTVGEALNPSTAVTHFEKAMPQFNGLAQVINQWFAQNNLADFAYINREQDLGIHGLRRAKESYFPEQMVEKVRVILPGSGSNMQKTTGQQACD